MIPKKEGRFNRGEKESHEKENDQNGKNIIGPYIDESYSQERIQKSIRLKYKLRRQQSHK